MKIGRINKIFYSIQGEGIYCGVEQVFIRMSGCNLKCRYCDTDHKEFAVFTPQQLYNEVKRLSRDKFVHSISITGGEPLLQVEFLEEFLPLLKGRGYKIYLETNGILVRGVDMIKEFIDIVAMDIKLPSSTGERHFWSEHRGFLEGVIESDCFVKVVVTEDTNHAEVKLASQLVAQVSREIPFVIQPVSNSAGEILVGDTQLESFREIAKAELYRVEVIPQLHKILGVK